MLVSAGWPCYGVYGLTVRFAERIVGETKSSETAEAGYKVSKQRKTVVFYNKSVAVQSGAVKSQAALSCT